MPTLPTITVTDAQLARITEAYGDVATYKAWLRAQVKDYVLRDEARQLDEAHNAAKRDALATLETSLTEQAV